MKKILFQKEDFERVRQHYGNLVSAVEELEVQTQAQNRRLQQYTRERDATLTSLENRYNKEREMAENVFQKFRKIKSIKRLQTYDDEFKNVEQLGKMKFPLCEKILRK